LIQEIEKLLRNPPSEDELKRKWGDEVAGNADVLYWFAGYDPSAGYCDFQASPRFSGCL